MGTFTPLNQTNSWLQSNHEFIFKKLVLNNWYFLKRPKFDYSILSYMKSGFFLKTVFFILVIPATFCVFHSCEMPATGFDPIEDAIFYTKDLKTEVSQPDSTLRVMTWNIRFGIGRGLWSIDACGDRVIFTGEEILEGLNNIADRIKHVRPDVLLLQEVHINSTCSAYIDELRWLLDHTYFNYAVYGTSWKSQFVPSDGLGRMHECNAVLSRWPITEAKRIQLSLRADQGSLVRYFDNRYCMVKAKIEIPGFKTFYAVNIHTAAFATDDTKKKQLESFKEVLDNIDQSGSKFVAGGDLNTIPPGSDSTDFCIEDMCPDESFHHPSDKQLHKDGSDYTPESEWMVPLYTKFKCAVPLNLYLSDQQAFFTHTTRPGHFWDRTLDYLFTNNRWREGSFITHQEFLYDSDHAPVSAEFVLERE
jgi:endonuclease/exonuclease/phosphatase family metal-dependent hydrolase